MRTEVRQTMTEADLKKGIPVVDLLPLKFENLSFGFHSTLRSQGDGKGDGLILTDITRDIKQGQSLSWFEL